MVSALTNSGLLQESMFVIGLGSCCIKLNNGWWKIKKQIMI